MRSRWQCPECGIVFEMEEAVLKDAREYHEDFHRGQVLTVFDQGFLASIRVRWRAPEGWPPCKE